VLPPVLHACHGFPHGFTQKLLASHEPPTPVNPQVALFLGFLLASYRSPSRHTCTGFFTIFLSSLWQEVTGAGFGANFFDV
jgi:hypothetical protein